MGRRWFQVPNSFSCRDIAHLKSAPWRHRSSCHGGAHKNVEKREYFHNGGSLWYSQWSMMFIYQWLNIFCQKIPRADFPFNSNLEFVQNIESSELSRPLGIAISKDNRLFVSDCFDGNLHEFDIDGKYIRKVRVPNSVGKEHEDDHAITGVTVDDFGNVLVCVVNPDPRIQVFKPDLTPFTTFGGDALQNPSDICILPNDDVAVADYYGKIVIF